MIYPKNIMHEVILARVARIIERYERRKLTEKELSTERN